MAFAIAAFIFWLSYYFISSQVVSVIFHKNILCTSVGLNSSKVQKCYDVPNKMGFGTPSELYEPLENKEIPEDVVASNFFFFSHMGLGAAVLLSSLVLRRLNSSGGRNAAAQEPGGYEATISLRTTEEEGRHAPFFSGYAAEIYTEGELVPVIFTLTNREMVSPGEIAEVVMRINAQSNLGMGQEFEIQDHGHIIGSGTITKIL